MKKLAIIATSILLALASEANAQSVSGRASGAVGGVGSVASQATAGVAGPSGSQTFSGAYLSTGSLAGGDLPGGIGVKLGDKVIQLRGDFGVGNDQSNFRAGVGVPF